MKNDYEIRGDITAIFINSPKYGKKEVLISSDKLARVKNGAGTWCLSWQKNIKSFYVTGKMKMANGKKKYVSLHRWITNAPESKCVDHRNHDTLDNRDDNLRICSHAGNSQNRKGAQSDSTSGIRGVSWHKQSEKWATRIEVNGKRIYLGSFANILEAEKAVKEARRKYMPYTQEA